MELMYEKARPKDAPVIFGFAKELIETYETDPDLDLNMALAWTKRKIEKRIGEYTRVLADGETAAFFRFVPDGERMELDDLYVLPAFRDRGIGTAVLRRCVAQGRPVYFYVFTKNTRAIDLYEREGFRKVEDVSPTRMIMARLWEETMKKKFITSAVCFGLFLLLIVLLKTVDVAAVGPEGTEIGLSKLNVAAHDLFGENLGWYKVTNILGYLAILIALGFAAIGGLQLIRRRSVLKVDKEILLLGCLYVVTVIFYVLFEKVIVNYRPILMPDGEGIEASFPSSHTVLSCVILGSGLMLLKKYMKKNKTVQTVLTVVFAVMLALIVAGRLISGVHWFTDIVGGVLLSAALLNAYEGLLKLWKKSDKRKR